MKRALILIPILLLVLAGLFLVLRPETPEDDDVAQQEDVIEEGDTETVLEVQVEESGMFPDEITVYEGERAVFILSSQRSVEFHVHGYDLTAEVEPGDTVELPFEADISGRFEIEDHNTEAVLGELIVQPI